MSSFDWHRTIFPFLYWSNEISSFFASYSRISLMEIDWWTEIHGGFSVASIPASIGDRGFNLDLTRILSKNIKDSKNGTGRSTEHDDIDEARFRNRYLQVYSCVSHIDNIGSRKQSFGDLSRKSEDQDGTQRKISQSVTYSMSSCDLKEQRSGTRHERSVCERVQEPRKRSPRERGR